MSIPVEINACRINSKNEDQVIMLCRNISERLQAKEELVKEKTLLRTLIDSLPSGVFIKDSNFRKIIANPIHIDSVKGHLKRNGLNADVNIIGKTDFEIFLPEEAKRFLEIEKEIIEKGAAIINNVEPGWGPNGERIWLLVSKVPIQTSDGTILGMVGITTDITVQKKVEEQLIIEKEKAEQSDKLKTAFLNNISHEIRTPLNAIVGFSGLMNDPSLSDEKRESFYQIISQSSNQLLMIISDIINIATIEAGQVKINYSRVEINSIMDILYLQHLPNANCKNLKFEYSKALSDTEATIETDETKFLEVLSNLINNAIKFTEKGKVSYSYTLENEIFTFFVADTGIGIKTEYHQQIFDRFWRVENISTQGSRGAGLGLSISKTYTELLGGKIWLDSKPNEGTTFYFTLPYKR
jgi:PAS domain S-box-containing protein